MGSMPPFEAYKEPLDVWIADILRWTKGVVEAGGIEYVKERLKALPTAIEPEAMRYDFDGFGWKYIDSGSGSDWQTRHPDAEPLFSLNAEECLSCGGLNTSCPDGCGRNPLTGELDGSRYVNSNDLERAREIVKQFYPEMPADYNGRRVQIVLETFRQIRMTK